MVFFFFFFFFLILQPHIENSNHLEKRFSTVKHYTVTKNKSKQQTCQQTHLKLLVFGQQSVKFSCNIAFTNQILKSASNYLHTVSNTRRSFPMFAPATIPGPPTNPQHTLPTQIKRHKAGFLLNKFRSNNQQWKQLH